MKQRIPIIGRERVALVTGGSSGIGLATARLLAQAGCHVWLVARGVQRLEAALAEVTAARQSEAQRCGMIPADVSDPQQALAAVERVIQEVGAPHLLVNSAGVARPGYVHELSLDDFRQMMEINYFGTVYMVKAVLPGMIARRSGHIVNISSVAGFLGVFGYSAYGASKFAVTGFSEILRAESKQYSIGVSIIFPPDVDTPQLKYEAQFRPAETRALVEGATILSPEKVAEAILRSVLRGQYAILPSGLAKALYIFTNGTSSLARPVMDWIVARAQQAASKNN